MIDTHTLKDIERTGETMITIGSESTPSNATESSPDSTKLSSSSAQYDGKGTLVRSPKRSEKHSTPETREMVPNLGLQQIALLLRSSVGNISGMELPWEDHRSLLSPSWRELHREHLM